MCEALNGLKARLFLLGANNFRDYASARPHKTTNSIATNLVPP